MTTPVIIIKNDYIPVTPEESLYSSARLASKYACELYNEFGFLSDLMKERYPKEAARFTTLVNALFSIKDITENRAELLVNKTYS
ncbi:hypothetical protein ID850_14940 [Xenorhabdus sp. Flor]|uniref:hypothetical protein n=1 Tax=Xenorhabdus cabanillasii TaxID=351673 RepID=UPI0019A1D9B4|nr:hypothetical protein [Xenorhabdus sp. Flor]MBD2816024.1 hypothetical protein [Xenorhabdus sp. Flor]